MGQPSMWRHSLSLTPESSGPHTLLEFPQVWVELACLHRLEVQSQLEVDLQTDIFLHEPAKLKVAE